jgi:hypothetical protein
MRRVAEQGKLTEPGSDEHGVGAVQHIPGVRRTNQR